MKKLMTGTALFASLLTFSVQAEDLPVQITFSEPPAQQITFSEMQFATSQGMQVLQGTGKNVTGQTIKHAVIRFNLLEGGKVVRDVMTRTENLGPGQQWHFQIPFNSLSIKPDSFKVSEVIISE
jgi:hypothetical protein